MKNYSSIFLQAAVWIGIWMVFAFTGNQADKDFSYYYILTLRVLGFALFFNVVFYALLPLYFKGNKRAFYSLTVVAFAIYIGVSVFADLRLYRKYIREQAEQREEVQEKEGGQDKEEEAPSRPLVYFFIPPIVLSMVLFGAAATFRGFSAFERKKVEEEEANRRRLEAEIALLKSQINPHFLLNTLNNLYALSHTEPEKTPDALFMLSGMVSYILYECASPYVPLARDLEFVEQYIELQRLRLPPNASLYVQLPEEVREDIQIEPMILIPFIENAFKHGLTTKIPVTLSITISLEGVRLNLCVENPVLPPKDSRQGNPSGIGMANTRKRLEHSYSGRYALDIEESEGRHRVKLSLNLQP